MTSSTFPHKWALHRGSTIAIGTTFIWPSAPTATVALAHNVAAIVKSVYGKSKKCLVLDLDNTLWGGVIGDDGVQN